MHAIILVVILHLVATLYAQEVGQTCVFDNTQNGTCKLFSKCRNLKVGEIPTICGYGYGEKHYLVCCGLSISEKKCNEWKLHDNLVERPTLRSEGGMESFIKEFPHMATLGSGKSHDKKWFCGGSLISEKFVLTAAHCIEHKDFGNVTNVRLGYFNLTSSNATDSHQDFEVVRRIKHPSYNASLQYNDIALLELDRAAKFNQYVHPACLQTIKVVHKPKMRALMATRWGLNLNGSYPINMKRVDLAEVYHADCKMFYNNQVPRTFPNGIVEESQICTDGYGQKITSEGDCGGLLQVSLDQYNSVHAIIGINSIGKACSFTQDPGVYTRVSKYVHWIESVVWEK